MTARTEELWLLSRTLPPVPPYSLVEVVTVPRWVGWCLIGNVLAHAVDMVLTWWGLAAGHIREGNPLLAPILGESLLIGAALKTIGILLGVTVMAWAYSRNTRLVTVGLVIISVGIVVAMGFHARWTIAAFT